MKNLIFFGCAIIIFAAVFVSCQKDQVFEENLIKSSTNFEDGNPQSKGKICSCTFSTVASATLNDDFGELWASTLHYTQSNGSPGIVSLGNHLNLPTSQVFYPSIPQDFDWVFEYDNTISGNGNSANGTATVSVVCNGNPGPIGINFPAVMQYNIPQGTQTYNNSLDSGINANCIAYGIY